jgi:hypothetical protein
MTWVDLSEIRTDFVARFLKCMLCFVRFVDEEPLEVGAEVVTHCSLISP